MDRQTGNAVHRSRKWILWVGRILSAIPVLMMLMSAVMKFLRPPQVLDAFVNQFGYPESELFILGVVELTSAVLFAIPRTACLGAILVTGYLGGAIATHARIGDPAFVGPLLLGILAWAGLYLRDDRLRQLLPLRQTHTT
jgi:DoxX-like family